MELTTDLISNIIEFCDIKTILENDIFYQQIYTIKIKRLFNEFNKIKYIEDFFKFLINDENCYKLLLKIDINEFKFYIDNDIDYDDKKNFKTSEYDIGEELIKLNYFKSIFFLLDLKVLDTISYSSLFQNLLSIHSNTSYITHFFDNYFGINKVFKINFGTNFTFSGKNPELLLFSIQKYDKYINYHKNFVFELYNKILTTNDIYLTILQIFISKNKKHSTTIYIKAIENNDLNIMKLLFKNNCPLICNTLYNYAEHNQEILKWLYKNNLTPSKKQNKKYKLQKL